MSWVAILWPMIASACLTLAAIHLLAWFRNREARASLLVSATAVASAGFTFLKWWMMRAQTPADLGTAIRWGHVPIFLWIVSITWFVRLNKQIAADLGIHERTVKLHRTAITTKLGGQSVAELTRLTDQAGLFTATGPTCP